jgi:anthranilate/para-aminobenzoate synthase component II
MNTPYLGGIIASCILIHGQIRSADKSKAAAKQIVNLQRSFAYTRYLSIDIRQKEQLGESCILAVDRPDCCLGLRDESWTDPPQWTCTQTGWKIPSRPH